MPHLVPACELTLRPWAAAVLAVVAAWNRAAGRRLFVVGPRLSRLIARHGFAPHRST